MQRAKNNFENRLIKIGGWIAFVLLLLFTTFYYAWSAPVIQILSSYVVSGGLTATTTANANLTATGTIAFPALASSNSCLITGTDGKLATTTCGGSGLTFGFATTTAGINVATTTNTVTLSLRSTLADLSGLATTTGNLIAGNNTNGWSILGVGSNGQVLTASSTATNGVSWETAATGGGGVSYNTLDFALNPAGAATATTSPAGSNKKIATNWTLHTLDYDGATQENAFWIHKFPAFTALNVCTFTGTAMASATTTGSVAVMGISYKDIGNNAAWSSSASTTASTTITFNTTLEDFVNFSIAISTTSISSADTFLVNLARRPAESDDTDTSDLRYTSGMLNCTYR